MDDKTREPVIRCRGLTRIYPLGESSVVGVSGVDLDVAAGEVVVLKGNSGSGKSTLLALLAGLDPPTSGELFVAGWDLGRNGRGDLTRFRREVVGMVFQAFNLLPTLTVIENVCLPALLAEKPRDAALGHRAGHLPAQLSGGEMQRTAIARALVNDPALILADEPTGNLDSRNGRAVIDLMAELNRDLGRTLVIATHSDLADAIATQRVRLRDGTVTKSACDG
jgi:ABC-type lipoprotein export system ATPase subunit